MKGLRTTEAFFIILVPLKKNGTELVLLKIV